MTATVQILDLFDQVCFSAFRARQLAYSRLTHANFGGIVRYGPLKGFKLDDNPSWAPEGLATKLFGLYEQEILKLVTELRGRHRILINLGAGDGYYGVGLVSAGFFEQSVCFELSENGQKATLRTAEKNGVVEKIKTRGAAEADFSKVFGELGIKAADCMIICDIEGAEFSIFSAECLAKLQGAHIIIELHGYLSPNGNALEERLVLDSKQFFQTSIVKTSARDLSSIPELEMVNDADRWLICSEGRPKLMSWLILSPK